MKTLKLTVLLLALMFLNACSDDNNEPDLPKGDYENGYFITNEGPFQNGSGSITFVGDDAVINQNIYKTVNGEDLGNIVNSMTIGINNVYIIVNNSNKIIIANRYTMKKVGVIEGSSIKQPRYMIINGGIGYISNWGDQSDPTDDFIAVVELESFTVLKIIPIGEGPENMELIDNKLFVALEGGWNQNNKIVVIDRSSNSIINTIEVDDVPNSLEIDNSGNLWVLCGGKPSWTGSEIAGALYKINTGNFNSSSFDFKLSEHPEHLTIDVNNLYYNLNGKVFGMDTKASELPTESVNGLDGFYYAMKAHDGELFATDAKDFVSEGDLKVFSINSGALIQTVTTGIIPGDVVFQ